MKNRYFSFALILALYVGAIPLFGGWMETYSQKKDVARLADYWDLTVARGGFETGSKSQDVATGFFGAALRGRPEIVTTRVKSLGQFPEGQRDAVSIVLWLSDMECSRIVLRKAGLPEMASARIPAVKDRKILSSSDASFLLGWFYATNDTDALSPLVMFIAEADWSRVDEKADACGGALSVLCASHERARMVVEDALKRTDLSETARKVFVFALGKKG